MTTRVMIVGCGDVGTATGERLLADRHNNIEICGVRRQADQLPPTFRKISADFSQRESFIAALAQQPADYVIYSAAATQHDEAGYQQAYVDGLQHTLDAIQHWPQAPKQLLFTSSTGVYHQADHSWVDESSATEPKRFSGRIMLEAEQLLANSSIDTSAVRFSGIYGPGRKRLINSVRSGKGAPPQPLSYSNRIHRDDCAGVLAHLIQLKQQGQSLHPVYLASDCQPASLSDVTHWLAQQLGVPLTDLSMGRFAGSKRCSNRRLLDSGYQFQYPDFRSGYRDLLR
jgi:nucleoside-diphosphate-sugar epimerase